ncbi:hypothetical protein AC622_08270 [Bacillus sp. FJAT-27916]|uniref:hypothetical protein n=1 Tax=Bacillaceae TaxID=186817 RepID=UPI0006711537|nr:hypothetical protein [Bacillus sp. FJAT-27916]KMY44249.1 hypothetical protein AC622_08270 [Bacillus sp. FJAT-27916]
MSNHHKPHPHHAPVRCRCTGSGIVPGQFPPGTKPISLTPLSNTSIRQLLIRFLQSGTTLAEVFTVASQIPGEPDLSNVTVVAVGGDFVTFQQSASLGGAQITIRIQDIIGFEVA